LNKICPTLSAKQQPLTIAYLKKFTNAQIVITDKNGKMLKQINISGSRKGIVNVEAASFSSGAYNYSLIIGGRIIGSKQMVLAR